MPRNDTADALSCPMPDTETIGTAPGRAPTAYADRYERVEYPGMPYARTHPDVLATMAKLFGMDPAAVDRCRVLELGCGDGANLVPMAFTLPHSHFVGVDIAAGAIEKGQACIADLGLDNIALRRNDVCRLDAAAGEFDYIIAHGLYAWVPPEVQQAILRVLATCLAPQGVAYVSYNTYPGGHLRNLAREMMLFHTRSIADPEQQVREACEFLHAVAEALDQGHAYRAFINGELRRMGERGGAYLFHDELSPVYRPLYFHEFMTQAAAHGLQYLGEAELCDMQRPKLPPAAAAVLDRAGDDLIAREQYLDFLRCRSFRRTLLCRDGVQLNRIADPACVWPLMAASPMQALSAEVSLDAESSQEFGGPAGSLSTRHPVTKAALSELAESWPVAVPMPELLARVRARLRRTHGPDYDADKLCLCEFTLRACAADMAELHVHQPPLCSRAGDTPQASALARWQARSQECITTLRHTSYVLSGPVERHLVSVLDGTRNRAALVAELSAYLTVTKSDIRIEDVPAQLEANLRCLARAGLLTS